MIWGLMFSMGITVNVKLINIIPDYLWNNKTKEYQNGRYSQDAIHEHALKFIRDNKDKAFSDILLIRYLMLS